MYDEIVFELTPQQLFDYIRLLNMENKLHTADPACIQTFLRNLGLEEEGEEANSPADLIHRACLYFARARKGDIQAADARIFAFLAWGQKAAVEAASPIPPSGFKVLKFRSLYDGDLQQALDGMEAAVEAGDFRTPSSWSSYMYRKNPYLGRLEDVPGKRERDDELPETLGTWFSRQTQDINPALSLLRPFLAYVNEYLIPDDARAWHFELRTQNLRTSDWHIDNKFRSAEHPDQLGIATCLFGPGTLFQEDRTRAQAVYQSYRPRIVPYEALSGAPIRSTVPGELAVFRIASESKGAFHASPPSQKARLFVRVLFIYKTAADITSKASKH